MISTSNKNPNFNFSGPANLPTFSCTPWSPAIDDDGYSIILKHKRSGRQVLMCACLDHYCQEDADAGRLDQTGGPSSLVSCLLLCFRNCFRFWGIKMYISFSHLVVNIMVTLQVLIILDLRAALWHWVPPIGLVHSFVKGMIVSSLYIFSLYFL